MKSHDTQLGRQVVGGYNDYFAFRCMVNGAGARLVTVIDELPCIYQGCQFSDFSLISDFLRIKETCIKLIKYGQNMDNISIVSKDRPAIGKGLDNTSLNTVSTHLNQFRLSSD